MTVRPFEPKFMKIGVLTAALSFVVGEAVVPWANRESRRVMVEEVDGGQLPRVTKNVMLRDFAAGRLSRLIYATDFDQETATMHNVAMLEWRDGEPFRQTTADRLVWEADGWYFVGGKTYLFAGPEGKGQVTEVSFRDGKQRVALSERPEDIPLSQKDPENMTMAELRTQMALLRQDREASKVYSLQYWLRFATPFSSVVFAFIGTPLGIQHHRRASSVGFGLSVVIIFAYYVLMTLFSALGRGGVVAPALAAWPPDVLLFLAGAWFVLRARK
jgi:lipopolysaccharide export system permease protein